jgi:hypothetical protein
MEAMPRPRPPRGHSPRPHGLVRAPQRQAHKAPGGVRYAGIHCRVSGGAFCEPTGHQKLYNGWDIGMAHRVLPRLSRMAGAL